MINVTHDVSILRNVIDYCNRKWEKASDARDAQPSMAIALHNGRMEAYEDVIQTARDLLRRYAARDTSRVDELVAADLMASALAVLHGQTQLGVREQYQAEAETALRALLSQYQLLRRA